jgi:hypothetical protein
MYTLIDHRIQESGSKNKMGEGAKTEVWPYDQVVKVREGWVDLEPVLPVSCRVAE